MNTDYQTVTLILADGRRCTYTGPVQLEEGAVVRSVEITEGRPLAQGMTWERINNES